MNKLPNRVLVLNGLCSGKECTPVLHPELEPWSKQFSRQKKNWLCHLPMTALEWYLRFAGITQPPAAFVASQCDSIPEGTRQCWLATPYNATVMRDWVRISPLETLEWREQDARWLSWLLNPLLAGEGLTMHAIGTNLLVTTLQSWKVQPVSYAEIDGQRLPNRHPDGEDGGRLMRLQSEIEMLLARDHQDCRRHSGVPMISGVWFWGLSGWPVFGAAATPPPVQTSDPRLGSLVSVDESADTAILHVSEFTELLSDIGIKPFPQELILAGQGCSVCLTPTLLPKLARDPWKPRECKKLESVYS